MELKLFFILILLFKSIEMDTPKYDSNSVGKWCIYCMWMIWNLIHETNKNKIIKVHFCMHQFIQYIHGSRLHSVQFILFIPFILISPFNPFIRLLQAQVNADWSGISFIRAWNSNTTFQIEITDEPKHMSVATRSSLIHQSCISLFIVIIIIFVLMEY